MPDSRPPVPRANRRTGEVLIPTAWAILASRVLDESASDSHRRSCAESLAELVLTASEKSATERIRAFPDKQEPGWTE